MIDKKITSPIAQSLTVTAQLENLEALQDFARTQASSVLSSAKILMRLELIVEELAINIINYGYKEKPGDIVFSCASRQIEPNRKEFVLVIRDQGTPFDPLTKPDADLQTDIDSSSIGGLGIFLTKKMADKLEYHHDGVSNILSVTLSDSLE